MPKKKVQKKRGGPEPLYARAIKSSTRKRDNKDEDAVPTSASVSSESDEDAEESSIVVDNGAVRVEAETADGKPKRMKKKLKRLSVNLTMCKYKVIRDTVEWLGWRITEHESDWQLWWTDMSVGEDRCMRLRRPQKLNHFPGMTEIAHKCKLARNLNRLRSVLPDLYNFHPETFNLPVDFLAFEYAALGDMEQRKGKGGKSNKSYIIKPDDGACGVGIFITRKPSAVPPKLACVAQRYLNKPLLIDDRKFDLRLYVLITSMTPLRVYLFPEGLARFATEKYEAVTSSNMGKRYMHLTNYSVNRNHKDFETDSAADAATGSKRSLAFVRSWLSDNGFDVKAVWREIEKVIVKTLLAIQPYVAHTYRTCISSNNDCVGFSCFDLLGFDIMLDHKAKPWIIEVNEMPSFETAAAIDLSTKTAVLLETFQLVCPTVQELRLLTEMTKTVKLAKEAKAAERRKSQPPPQPGAAGSGAAGKGEREQARLACSDLTAEQEIRQELVSLRLEQEAYQRTRFRLIFPLTDPEADGRCNEAAPRGKGVPAAGRRYVEEPEAIELGLGEELWEFVNTCASEARERDAALMAEYEQCMDASMEIFDNNLWLRLGKVPSSNRQQHQQLQQLQQHQQQRSGAPPVMVQAGQGALLSQMRQQLLREGGAPSTAASPHPPTPTLVGEHEGERSVPSAGGCGDAHAPAHVHVLSPGGGGGRNARHDVHGCAHEYTHGNSAEMLRSDSRALSCYSPAVSTSPSIISSAAPSPHGFKDRVSGEHRGQGGGEAGTRSRGSVDMLDDGRGSEIGGGGVGVSREATHAMLHGSGQNNTAVLQRLALLRRELDEKRAADDKASLSIGGAAALQQHRRQSLTGSAGMLSIPAGRQVASKAANVVGAQDGSQCHVLFSKSNSGLGGMHSMPPVPGTAARGGGGDLLMPPSMYAVAGGSGNIGSSTRGDAGHGHAHGGHGSHGRVMGCTIQFNDATPQTLGGGGSARGGGGGATAAGGWVSAMSMAPSRSGTANTLDSARKEVKALAASVFGGVAARGELPRGKKSGNSNSLSISGVPASGLFKTLESGFGGGHEVQGVLGLKMRNRTPSVSRSSKAEFVGAPAQSSSVFMCKSLGHLGVHF